MTGVPLTSFDKRVRREDWPRPHPGVRLLPGIPAPSFLTQVSVALLALGGEVLDGEVLVTGWAGLHLHGVLTKPPPIVTLVVPWRHGRRRLRAVRIVRSRTLIDDDRAVVSGLSVASVERCFIDAARTDSRARLRILLIDARQRRIIEPKAVATRALRHPKIPGARRLIAAARDVDSTGVDSALSDAVHQRLLDAGFVPDAVPVPVVTPRGRTLHPDITFAAAKVCIECDSLGFHGSQRAIDVDHRKNQGYQQAGQNCLRIGWHRYDHDWEGFLADLRAALRG
ncbi:hypothetical protein BH23ACT10_BH23ACT10_18460 [soil metagenome]